jgi:riboflavin synthase
MFTGIVQRGRVASVEDTGGALRLGIEAPGIAERVVLGDSVSISGVCLTVVERAGDVLSFEAVPETLERSSLGDLAAGRTVNLESAARVGDALGGHYVQGHVDGVGSVRSVAPEGAGRRLWFDAPPDILRYVVHKGSVAVEGVSLTVADLDDTGFAVALIPHTLSETTLGDAAAGDPVNLEVDVLAKYVERLLPPR